MIEKNFTPLISHAWKNSHHLFYIASTKIPHHLIYMEKIIPYSSQNDISDIDFPKIVKGYDMIA